VLGRELENHLLLLDRLKTSLADVGGSISETTVRCGREMVDPPLPLAPRFDETEFNEPFQTGSRLGLGFLN
jgi:hypothetical protein